jgi:Flp pilus assembly protein TadD
MKAVELASRAVKTSPKKGSLWNTLGVAQYRAGCWKEAIVSLTRSLELVSDQTESINTFFLAMAHWQIGEKEKAREWCHQAVRWMEKNGEYLEKNAANRIDLQRFRAEAEALLSVTNK